MRIRDRLNLHGLIHEAAIGAALGLDVDRPIESLHQSAVLSGSEADRLKIRLVIAATLEQIRQVGVDRSDDWIANEICFTIGLEPDMTVATMRERVAEPDPSTVRHFEVVRDPNVPPGVAFGINPATVIHAPSGVFPIGGGEAIGGSEGTGDITYEVGGGGMPKVTVGGFENNPLPPGLRHWKDVAGDRGDVHVDEQGHGHRYRANPDLAAALKGAGTRFVRIDHSPEPERVTLVDLGHAYEAGFRAGRASV